MTGEAAAQPRSGSWANREIPFDLPKTWVRYYVRNDRTEPLSASGLLIKVQMQKNFDEGGLEFWTQLVRTVLLERRAIALKDSRQVTVKGGAKAVLFSGSRTVGGQPQGYLLLLAVNKRDIVTFEAWGPMETFAAGRASLEEAAASVRLKR